jgi:hypothetical protein
MSRKKSHTGPSGVVQVVVSLAIVIAATAGAGHSGVASPRPPTVCAQLRVLEVSHVVRHI